MSQHLWSGRFDSAPDPAAFDFGVSFPFDRRLFEDDVTGSLAWAEALTNAGVLAAADAKAIAEALSAILQQGRTDPAWVNGVDEDVHSFVERQLVARVGDAGRRLHTGRSRNEQVSLDLRLYLRRRIPLLQEKLRAAITAFADQAERAGDALMPSYTHMRRAMPVLVSHFLLSHAAALRRDHQRLEIAREEANAMPLGSGAIAGTGYAVDTAALAARLGFARVVANSMDASSDRDFAVSFLHAVSLSMIHLSRIAEDFILMTGEEFGFFELADSSATGSSMMPQKKNPDPLELVRGKAGRAIGHLTGFLITMKGLPTGYNKDLQEDKEPLFDSEDTLAVSLDATAAVIGKLGLHPERTGRAASGLLLATDVADYLVSRGMPFRQSHEVVGAMVRKLLAEGRDFEALSLPEWRESSTLFADDVKERVTAAASVRARKTPQSTHPDAVAAALADLRVWLARGTGLCYIPVALRPAVYRPNRRFPHSTRPSAALVFAAHGPTVRSSRRPVPIRLGGRLIGFSGELHARPPVSARRRDGRLLSARAPHYGSCHRGHGRRNHPTHALRQLRGRARIQGGQGPGATPQDPTPRAVCASARWPAGRDPASPITAATPITCCG